VDALTVMRDAGTSAGWMPAGQRPPAPVALAAARPTTSPGHMKRFGNGIRHARRTRVSHLLCRPTLAATLACSRSRVNRVAAKLVQLDVTYSFMTLWL